MNPYVDPTRAYVIPPQPEPEPKGIDKFGKFFWIPILILAIVDFMSDPPILTLILAIVVIGGAIFALSRKYKMKGFIIIALIMSAICILTSVSQGKKYGWFRIPDKSEYTSSSNVVTKYICHKYRSDRGGWIKEERQEALWNRCAPDLPEWLYEHIG